MSTGKRLAKRSIIGTRVSARGQDGKYYNGYIHALKSPAFTTAKDSLNISGNTLYSVTFDTVPGTTPPSPNTEFVGRDLIAPGFKSIDSATFVAGQKVYLTYNGREIQAEVIHHRKELDEVDVMIAPNGQEGTVVLTKRIDDLRLSESRKSPRLADQDTDFARLADMGSDRKRSASHTIEVPQVPGSRKRRPSSNYDSERPYRSNGGANVAVGSGGGENYQGTARVKRSCGRYGCPTAQRGDCMDACTAALVLMSLSHSPHSPYSRPQTQNEQIYGSSGDNGVAANSPVGYCESCCSNSSSASWRTTTPSPVSDEGTSSTDKAWQNPPNNQPTSPYTASGSPSGSTPGSSGTWDEGIERDYADELNRPRKKTKKLSDYRAKVRRERVDNRKPATGYRFDNCDQASTPLEIRFETTPLQIKFETTPPPQLPIQRTTPVSQQSNSAAQRYTSEAQRYSPVAQRPATVNNTVENHEGLAAAAFIFENKPPIKPQQNLFQCTWSSCTVVEGTEADIEDHVRHQHLEPQRKMQLARGIVEAIQDGEEQFYYQEVEAKTMSPSPTMSHRDMARPPHEDPEYQRQLRLVSAPSAILVDTAVSFGNNNNNVVKEARSASVIRKNNSKNNTIITFGVSSPSPQPLQPLEITGPVKQIKVKAGVKKPRKTPSCPRKGRSETKKCRKIHGMINKTTWCKQCKWKKACTRYCG